MNQISEQTLVKMTNRDDSKREYREAIQAELSELKAAQAKLGSYISSVEATLNGEVSFLALDRHDEFAEWMPTIKGNLKRLRTVMVNRAKSLLKGRQ